MLFVPVLLLDIIRFARFGDEVQHRQYICSLGSKEPGLLGVLHAFLQIIDSNSPLSSSWFNLANTGQVTLA